MREDFVNLNDIGVAAVLPPPEEQRKVKTALGAAKAEQSAEKARLGNVRARVAPAAAGRPRRMPREQR